MKTNLFKLENYYKRFYELTATSKNHREAFEKLDEEFREQFGESRHTSYESFTSAKFVYMNK